MKNYQITIIEEDSTGYSTLISAPSLMEAVIQFLLEIYELDTCPSFKSISAALTTK